jgi:hypothetical protein
MDTPLASGDDVYIGAWTNWSRGRVYGATLTLGRREGGYLSAFLALFVTLVGTSAWRIACFALHWLLSSRLPKDAIHHQRQAILRNSATATSGMWSVLMLSWGYRKSWAAQRLWRTLPLLGLAATIVAGFAVASIFTSRIATVMGDQVLLKGRKCGWYYTDAGRTLERSSEYNIKHLVSGSDYALRCYGAASRSNGCALFPRRQLSWSSDADAPCPFPGQLRVCRRNATNLRLDSGLINTLVDLGINLPPHESISFRRVVECAPLRTRKFAQNYTVLLSNREYNFTRYRYGTHMVINDGANTTHVYSADPPRSAASEHYDYNLW